MPLFVMPLFVKTLIGKTITLEIKKILSYYSIILLFYPILLY